MNPQGQQQSVYTSTAITTELIQQYLDENKQLILAILDNQNLGKLNECAQYQARLQQNLMYLAAIADAQPQAPQPQATSQQGVPQGQAYPPQQPQQMAQRPAGAYMQAPQQQQAHPQQPQQQQQAQNQQQMQHQHQPQQPTQQPQGMVQGIGPDGAMPMMTGDGGSGVSLTAASGYQDYSHGGATVVGSDRMASGMPTGGDLSSVGNVSSGMMQPGSTNGTAENGAAIGGNQGQALEASFLKDSSSA